MTFLSLLQAETVRDSMAKSLYNALFDWIVFRINHALLNQRDLEESAKVKSFFTDKSQTIENEWSPSESPDINYITQQEYEFI